MTDEGIQQEETVDTGCVSITITNTSEKLIKNATVVLSDGFNIYSGRTTYSGECVLSDVVYGSYNLNITRTGYEPITGTLVVDDEAITASYTLTPVPDDPNQIDVDVEEFYTFCITKQVEPVYGVSTNILEWLKQNMESMLDDLEHPIFGKVNTGFNDNILKTFGKKPVCDVYINKVEYDTDFDRTIPVRVHSIVLFYLKGANNHTYLKGCELHDLVMQEFITNHSFKWLDNVVRDTRVTNSEIRNQTIRGGYGVMGAFELTHDLY